MFSLYVKLATKSKFVPIVKYNVDNEGAEYRCLFDAITDIQKMIPPGSTSTFQIREGRAVKWEWKPSNDPRSIETIVGDNLGVLHLKVDKHHVAETYLSVCRSIKASLRNWDKIPRPLRRGMYRAILDRHCHNRQQYLEVMRQSW